MFINMLIQCNYMNNQFITKQKSQIVASKKCELCDSKILIVATKLTRPNGSIVRGNKELPHDCDGGEEKFIRAHEITDKEYFERYAPDVNQWEGWDYLQR